MKSGHVSVKTVKLCLRFFFSSQEPIYFPICSSSSTAIELLSKMYLTLVTWRLGLYDCKVLLAKSFLTKNDRSNS